MTRHAQLSCGLAGSSRFRGRGLAQCRLARQPSATAKCDTASPGDAPGAFGALLPSAPEAERRPSPRPFPRGGWANFHRRPRWFSRSHFQARRYSRVGVSRGVRAWVLMQARATYPERRMPLGTRSAMSDHRLASQDVADQHPAAPGVLLLMPDSPSPLSVQPTRCPLSSGVRARVRAALPSVRAGSRMSSG